MAQPRLVMKFGGTSVADLERLGRVARLVAAEVRAGCSVAVVVSAMSGKTNELVAWTHSAGKPAQGIDVSDDAAAVEASHQPSRQSGCTNGPSGGGVGGA